MTPSGTYPRPPPNSNRAFTTQTRVAEGRRCFRNAGPRDPGACSRAAPSGGAPPAPPAAPASRTGHGGYQRSRLVSSITACAPTSRGAGREATERENVRACGGRGCLSAPVTHSRTPGNARNVDKVLAPELGCSPAGQRAGRGRSVGARVCGPHRPQRTPGPGRVAGAARAPGEPSTAPLRTPSLTSGGAAGPEVGTERRGLNMAAGP